MKTIVVYWFRNDLRVEDNPALNHACALAGDLGAYLLPVFCHTSSYGALRSSKTSWGFVRMSQHRQIFLHATLADLHRQLGSYNLALLELDGEFSEQVDFLAHLAQNYALETIVCEDIVAPEEISQVQSLQALGLPVHSVWQSSMYDPADFDFPLARLPDQFTAFRHKIESHDYPIRTPAPCRLSSSLALSDHALFQFSSRHRSDIALDYDQLVPDHRSSFPYWKTEFHGGSQAAMQHLERYFSTALAHTYKQTRNQLHGVPFSTKFSPWLASGALSAPQIVHALRAFEKHKGKSDSSYWIWFELLWRDYFRFLHHKFGAILYRARGMSKTPIVPPRFDAETFRRWTHSETGEPLIDAAMRELKTTGYLSNRLRQQVASYWLHELAGDWRVAAAWFESQLLDYDVYSNQGNYLYLAGLGTDPRGPVGGRWFDPKKQAQQHDADGSYRQLWNSI